MQAKDTVKTIVKYTITLLNALDGHEGDKVKMVEDWTKWEAIVLQEIRTRAEISFKAGWGAHEKIVPEQLKAHGDICYKAGYKEGYKQVKKDDKEASI